MEPRGFYRACGSGAGGTTGDSSCRIQRAFAVGEHVEAARPPMPRVVHEVRHDVTPGKGRLEELTREEAPVARQGKVRRLQGHDVRRDLGRDELRFQRRHMFWWPRQTVVDHDGSIEWMDADA